MNKMILGIIGSVIILPVYSQHYIKGIIIDSENAVMPMVNVAFLSQADSTLVTGAGRLRRKDGGTDKKREEHPEDGCGGSMAQ